MSQFEFLMMVASVVVAIGISEILGGWGKLLRSDRQVRFDWLHVGVTIGLLLAIIQYWVGMWAYRPLALESVVQIYFLVLPSFFMVLAAYAIMPDPADFPALNLRDYYMSRRRVYYSAGIAATVGSVLADVIIAGPDQVEPTLFIIFGFAVCMNAVLILTERVWVHGLAMLLGYLQLALFLASSVTELNQRFVAG